MMNLRFRIDHLLNEEYCNMLCKWSIIMNSVFRLKCFSFIFRQLQNGKCTTTATKMYLYNIQNMHKSFCSNGHWKWYHVSCLLLLCGVCQMFVRLVCWYDQFRSHILTSPHNFCAKYQFCAMLHLLVCAPVYFRFCIKTTTTIKK